MLKYSRDLTLNQNVIDGLLKCLLNVQNKKDEFVKKNAGEYNLSAKRDYKKLFEKIDVFQLSESDLPLLDPNQQGCFVKISNYREPPNDSLETPENHKRSHSPPLTSTEVRPFMQGDMFDITAVPSQVIQVPNIADET